MIVYMLILMACIIAGLNFVKVRTKNKNISPSAETEIRRVRKSILIAIGLVFGLVGIFYGLKLANNETLPGRLTSSLQELAIDKNIFTTSKLIKYDEEDPVNPNGDGAMEGTFQLSKEEIATLLSADPPLTCPPKERCTVEGTGYAHDKTRTVYTCQVLVPGGILYDLVVDTSTNQVTWRVAWY